jgi:hypothetical protein
LKYGKTRNKKANDEPLDTSDPIPYPQTQEEWDALTARALEAQAKREAAEAAAATQLDTQTQWEATPE